MVRSLRRRTIAVLLGAALLAGRADPAWAQSASDKAAAEALFRDGRRLMAAGKFAEACPKLLASNRLDPAIGTLLNLADCYERQGKTASAWAQFRDAAAVAREAGDRRREQAAVERAEALEPRLSTITIRPPEPAVAGLEVRRDREPIDPAVFGTALPVDPGTHRVEATAPGRKPWASDVTVPAEKGAVEVVIPALEAAGGASSAPPPPTAVPAPGDAAAPDAASGGGLGGRRTVALLAGGVGVVGLAVGTIFGLRASSRWSAAQDGHCKGGRCDAEGVDLATSAGTSADIATVGFVVGVVGVGAGAALWFTAGGGESGGEAPAAALSTRVSSDGAAVHVVGVF